MSVSEVNIRNKKAGFQYEILETYTAGLQLMGTEVKSIRAQKASINEAYCAFLGEELFVKQMNIQEYSHGTHYNHEPKRDRKLLLNRTELHKLRKKTQEKGLTIIPLKLFTNDKGLIKLDIALAKGKKLFDKRETIKTKDVKREMDRKMKSVR